MKPIIIIIRLEIKTRPPFFVVNQVRIANLINNVTARA
jgi:hypothetical protein